jgi:hypothetical protein
MIIQLLPALAMTGLTENVAQTGAFSREQMLFLSLQAGLETLRAQRIYYVKEMQSIRWNIQ